MGRLGLQGLLKALGVKKWPKIDYFRQRLVIFGLLGDKIIAQKSILSSFLGDHEVWFLGPSFILAETGTKIYFPDNLSSLEKFFFQSFKKKGFDILGSFFATWVDSITCGLGLAIKAS